MVAKGPELRQRTATGQGSVLTDDICDGVSVEEVVVKFAVGSTEGIVVGRTVSHIEVCLKVVIKEDTVDIVISQCNEERNGLVQCLEGWILYMWIRVVCIPHGVVIANLIEKTGFVSETVESFITKKLFGNLETAGVIPGMNNMSFLAHLLNFFLCERFCFL